MLESLKCGLRIPLAFHPISGASPRFHAWREDKSADPELILWLRSRESGVNRGSLRFTPLKSFKSVAALLSAVVNLPLDRGITPSCDHRKLVSGP